MREWLKRVVLKTDHRHHSVLRFSSQIFEAVRFSVRREILA